MPTNEQEQVLKTVQRSDFANGGLLDPKRQKQFIKYIRENGKMLDMVRFETLNQTQSTVDKLYIGEPVTHAIEENDPTAYLAKPVTGQVRFQTKKLKSSWNITTETLVDNLEQQGFEQTMMDGMSRRISTDLELLAIQGDETAYAGATDVFGRLLKRQDGWDKLTQGAHILDVGGQSIQKGVFAEMIRAMPQQYLQDSGLRWFVSKSVAIDWLDLLADRATGLGDSALNGNSVSPYGIPMVEVPLIPDNKALNTKAGIAAKVIGTRQDPFVITAGANDKLLLNVDAAGNQTITLPAGTWTAAEVASFINSVIPGIASDNSNGKVILKSTTTGAASTVARNAVANDAYATLGFTAGTTTGAANGTTGSIPEGSFIWLANPKNFIAAMRGNTRIYSEFNKDYDRLETVVYNEVDFAVENLDAIVKAVNVRKRQLV